MARIKVAKQSDLEDVSTNLGNLTSTVEDPTTGLSPKVTANETAIENVNTTIGADDTSGLRARIKSTEDGIGDANSGLTKDKNDLYDIVGVNNSSGLQGRTGELEDTVGTSTAGLVKDVADLQTKTADLSYDEATKRYSQTTETTATASDNKHVLTKKDGDELYASSKIGAVAVYRLRASTTMTNSGGSSSPILGTSGVTIEQNLLSASSSIAISDGNKFTFSDGVWRLEFWPSYASTTELGEDEFFRLSFRDVTDNENLPVPTTGLVGTTGYLQNDVVTCHIDATESAKQVFLNRITYSDAAGVVIRGFSGTDTRASRFIFTRIG